MWRHLDVLDHVWVFGPHPLGLLLVALARARGRRVTLGVRQDTVAYFAARATGSGRRARLLLAPRLLHAAWVGLARALPTTVVGPFLERRYGGPRRGLLSMPVSLVPERALAQAPAATGWTAPVELLTVGRIEPEKTPFVLLEALRLLEQRAPGRFSLTWVGEGRLRGAVDERAAALGLADRVRLDGFLAVGEPLFARYRAADAFVHCARTEGLPQVLVEAQAFGLPVVATDVGGVRDVLDGGRAGLLVGPQDPVALADAIQRLDADAGLRERLVSRGRESARAMTLEATSRAAADFIARERA
jgi:glycosyltransferase involved in cell wall biosynthesis